MKVEGFCRRTECNVCGFRVIPRKEGGNMRCERLQRIGRFRVVV